MHNALWADIWYRLHQRKEERIFKRRISSSISRNENLKKWYCLWIVRVERLGQKIEEDKILFCFLKDSRKVRKQRKNKIQL